MFRFPASHAQVAPRGPAASITATLSSYRHFFFADKTRPAFQQTPGTTPPASPDAAPRKPLLSLSDMSEERMARWCRRLWDITRQSADAVQPTHLLPRLNPMHEVQLKAMDAAAIAARKSGDGARTTSASVAVDAAAADSAAAPSTAVHPLTAAEVESMEVDDLLARLQRAIRGGYGRVPSAIVEDVWAVFDLLVPSQVQRNVSVASITPAIEERFFAFVSTLNELDFDLQAVVEASKELREKLDAYLAQLRQLEDTEKQLAASQLRKSATDRANEASEATERLMKAKSEVMRCCFQARNVGAPLYYTWLRHTASLSDGLRRLMHFRKLAHYFESLCKKKIKSCDSRLKSATADLAPEVVDDLVRQQFKWRNRRIEVGLIDSALSLLFHDFFSQEYLVMEELTWFSTPPSLLDQIMRAESVHPFIGGLDDMRYRLQPAHHRHLFAFLHPAVVEEPLIAVQVALTDGIASSVDRILGRPTPLADPANTTDAAQLFRQQSTTEASAAATGGETADGNVNTAIFYSINSAQSALRGMDMGNRLIKRVVKEVEGNINASRQARHLTPIHTFSTLSPIPLYGKWLAGEVAVLAQKSAAPSGIFGVKLTPEAEEQRYFGPLRDAVAGYISRHPAVLPAEAKAVTDSVAAAATSAGDSHARRHRANVAVLQYLVGLFQTSPVDPAVGAGGAPAAHGVKTEAAGRWWNDHAFTKALEEPLLRSVAVYLCTIKRPGSRRIRDPVGNFHVSNGATVYRLNFLGNTTEQGSRESACVMVNYWYDLPTVSANVTEYEVSQHVALGEPITALLGEEVG